MLGQEGAWFGGEDGDQLKWVRATKDQRICKHVTIENSKAPNQAQSFQSEESSFFTSQCPCLVGKGIWRPLSAPRRWLSFIPVCPATGGSCLSHEYLVTQTTLSMNLWQGFNLQLSVKFATPLQTSTCVCGASLL
ncbi:hypothetical protein ILYODFUR_029446 [Ilyodon furcidens]|uniref:Uncharacterized protein n=1 Tax=Ilyodon furcidens TaxID=33524 RepID=A0ABV0SRX8_9TELE